MWFEGGKGDLTLKSGCPVRQGISANIRGSDLEEEGCWKKLVPLPLFLRHPLATHRTQPLVNNPPIPPHLQEERRSQTSWGHSRVPNTHPKGTPHSSTPEGQPVHLTYEINTSRAPASLAVCTKWPAEPKPTGPGRIKGEHKDIPPTPLFCRMKEQERFTIYSLRWLQAEACLFCFSV